MLIIFVRLLFAMENFLTYFCSLQLELLGIVQCIPILHLLVDRGPQKELCFNYWYGIIYTSAAENMIAMDSSILQLYKDGRIDKHTAISEAVNPEIMSKRLNLL